MHCPRNYAIVGLEPILGDRGTPPNVPISGFCCPLPPDALTEDHVEEAEECPEDFVATGSRVEEQYFSDLRNPEKVVADLMYSYRHFMRCTKINTKRYELSASTPLLYLPSWNTACVDVPAFPLPHS